MKMKTQKVEKMVKTVLNNFIDIELYEWPPRCATIFYQPVRPESENIISKKCDNENSCSTASE